VALASFGNVTLIDLPQPAYLSSLIVSVSLVVEIYGTLLPPILKLPLNFAQVI
jgi:hypothetical protein